MAATRISHCALKCLGAGDGAFYLCYLAVIDGTFERAAVGLEREPLRQVVGEENALGEEG